MTLSVIIPSFNQRKLLKACLVSIFKETQKISFELMVVDNASNDGTPLEVQKNFPQVLLLQNKSNLGFAKACNQGARAAKGDYLLFLNQDTEIRDRALEKMVNFMEKNQEVDISGCKLLNQDGSLQPSVGFFPRLSKIFFWAFFLDDLPVLNRLIKPYHQEAKSFYTKTREVDWVTGAFLLTKKKVFKEIGGFDERFFMYAEEVDFCFRAKKVGFKVFYTPEATIIHKRDQFSENAILGEFKGLKIFFKRHKPFWEPPILRVLLKFAAFNRILLFGILKGNAKRKRLFQKAFRLA